MYVDDAGMRHIVGMLHVALPPADSSGAESIRASTIGLAFSQSRFGSSIAFGYSDVTSTALRNNSCVRLMAETTSYLPREEHEPVPSHH
jgi:hypothetical protein